MVANRKRKEIEQAMLAECEAHLERDGPGRGALVLAKEGWHPGVAGIVAARLVDRYHLPTFVIAVTDGLGRGSIRSIPELPLEPFYRVARPSTRSIGGHACAGGLTVEAHRIEEFRHAIETACPEQPMGGGRDLHVDAVLPLSAIDVPLIDSLEVLAPFGHANPLPRFRLDGLELATGPRLVGKAEDHLSFPVCQKGRLLRAIFFRGARHAHALARSRRPFSMVCELSVNEYRGARTAELRVVDLDLSP